MIDSKAPPWRTAEPIVYPLRTGGPQNRARFAGFGDQLRDSLLYRARLLITCAVRLIVKEGGVRILSRLNFPGTRNVSVLPIQSGMHF